MDDVPIPALSTSLKKNIRLLEKDVTTLFGLGVPCTIQFDTAKTELIHFTTGKKSLTATFTLPDQTIVIPRPVVNWLGIYLDNTLSFKKHVSIRTSQAWSAFYQMCRRYLIGLLPCCSDLVPMIYILPILCLLSPNVGLCGPKA
jgi:hypothetical protein